MKQLSMDITPFKNWRKLSLSRLFPTTIIHARGLKSFNQAFVSLCEQKKNNSHNADVLSYCYHWGNFEFKRVWWLCLAVLASSAANAATLVVDSMGSGTHTTIQAAVDAATAGDIIQINPHSDSKGYRENVVVNTANIILRGNTNGATASEDSQTCPTAVIDGCETAEDSSGCGATQLLISAADVTVERLTFRHGEIRIDTGGDNATFSEICVIDPENDAIQTTNGSGDQVRVNGISVDRSVFQGGRSQNIAIVSNNASITASTFFAADDGIQIYGTDFWQYHWCM